MEEGIIARSSFLECVGGWVNIDEKTNKEIKQSHYNMVANLSSAHVFYKCY